MFRALLRDRSRNSQQVADVSGTGSSSRRAYLRVSVYLGVFLGSVLGATLIAYAAGLEVPYTFKSGSQISASQINKNFKAIYKFANELNDRITNLENRATTLVTLHSGSDVIGAGQVRYLGVSGLYENVFEFPAPRAGSAKNLTAWVQQNTLNNRLTVAILKNGVPEGYRGVDFPSGYTGYLSNFIDPPIEFEAGDILTIAVSSMGSRSGSASDLSVMFEY